MTSIAPHPEVQTPADTARDAAFLLDPLGEDPAIELMVAAVAYLSACPDDEDLDERLLERAARATWGDELPPAIAERLGLDSDPVEPGEFVAPTRDQEDVFHALALEHDQVEVTRIATAAQPRLFEARCVDRGLVTIVYRVYPSGLRAVA